MQTQYGSLDDNTNHLDKYVFKSPLIELHNHVYTQKKTESKNVFHELLLQSKTLTGFKLHNPKIIKAFRIL
jgi:hypothetical protein